MEGRVVVLFVECLFYECAGARDEGGRGSFRGDVAGGVERRDLVRTSRFVGDDGNRSGGVCQSNLSKSRLGVKPCDGFFGVGVMLWVC